ncbi:MAG: AMP-binding protein [Candidatus Yanofskybacteria bacterium]|nr:AMP-binding protein [Candidatus Yanofskybacteria bacterium]
MLNQKVDNEILVIGKCVMLGYYQNETANQKAFSAQRTLYFTGDIGEMSPDQKIIYKGKKGRSFKLANGEYISDATVEFLEESAKSILRDIDPQTEVVICGDGQPQVVALVFISNKKNAKLYETIQSSLETVGEGLTKIKKVVILDSQTDLLLTPTLKPRYKEMIDKFKNLIID